VIKQEVFVKMSAVENSTQIAAVGYDPAIQELHVSFKNGGTYAYEGVPDTMADAFVKSESLGRFLGQHIKGAFPHRKVS
jgi:hypothetical protein